MSQEAFGHGRERRARPQASNAQEAPAAHVGWGDHFRKGRLGQRMTANGQHELPAACCGQGGGTAPRCVAEARPFLGDEAQRQGQRFRRTWMNWKGFKEESKSNDDITYPAQRKRSTPGIVCLEGPAWLQLTTTFRNLKFVNVLIYHTNS